MAKKAAVGVERELRLDHLVAALIVAEERFRPLAGPFDRPADPFRRPGHQREFRIEGIAGAEIAADVARHHPHRRRRNAEHARQLVLLPHHPAAAGVERVAAALLVIGADGGAGIERHAGDALHPGLQGHHVGGLRKGRGGRGGIAHVGVDADVGDLVVEPRCAGLRRGRGRGHRLQRLVVDRHPLGGVLGGRQSLRHHHHDGVADEADAVGRQDRMRRHAVRGAVAVLERDVGGRSERRRMVRDRLEPVGDRVGPGEHRQHAGQRARRLRVDRADAGMRVRRAQHDRAGLAGQRKIVAVGAAAGEETHVLLAGQRLSDRYGHGRASTPAKAQLYVVSCVFRVHSPSSSLARIPSSRNSSSASATSRPSRLPSASMICAKYIGPLSSACRTV